jgi:ribonuclease P protein component|tara:strand:+ start:4104 stop:4508 length:405 start_codon:yes stop_codon:yes gene_type:complete
VNSPDLRLPPGTGFDKTRRLLTAEHYRRVFAAPDARASHRQILLLARTNEQPGHRLGLVVAKKNVRKAVQRNRIKRIAREVFRFQPSQPLNLDVIVLARRGLDELDNPALAKLLREQWSRLLRTSQHNRDKRPC